MAEVQPSHLLHLAWQVVPGKWAANTSTESLVWVQGSLEILRQFSEAGGIRVVMAGSCTEYDWNLGYCSELSTPRNPHSFYGVCKNALQAVAEAYANRAGVSSAWSRVFFLYGPHEHPARLVSSVILSLIRSEQARCSHGNQIRDYLHVEDVADALVALLSSDVRGPVNIASGRPVTVRNIVRKIAERLGRSDMVKFGAIPVSEGEYPFVIGDVRRINREVGWEPRYDLDTGLEQTISWWIKESATATHVATK